jgi:hypothetical protein
MDPFHEYLLDHPEVYNHPAICTALCGWNHGLRLHMGNYFPAVPVEETALATVVRHPMPCINLDLTLNREHRLGSSSMVVYLLEYTGFFL